MRFEVQHKRRWWVSAGTVDAPDAIAAACYIARMKRTRRVRVRPEDSRDRWLYYRVKLDTDEDDA